MLKVDLSKFDITNYMASANQADIRVGARWDLKGPMGPNNSLVLEGGTYVQDASNQYEKARECIDSFFTSLRDNQKIEGLLRTAWDLTSERFQKEDMNLEDFVKKFQSEPNFKDSFRENFMPPGCLMIKEGGKSKVVFLVNGNYIANNDSAGNPVYYMVVVVLKENNWLIDKFENVTPEIWQKSLPN